jgi:hypothetical protein
VLEPDSPWRRILSLSSGAKAGAAAVVGSLALGGVAAAATGMVPVGPLHGVADFLGAPSSVSAPKSDEPSESASHSESTEPSESESSSSSTPPTDPALAVATATGSYSPTQGPNPLGPAAWGLCHAFGNKTWGNGAFATSTESPNADGRKPDNPSVAYQNLKDAAKSLNMTVDVFCTYVIANHAVPTATATSTSTDANTPTGVMSTAPSVTDRGPGNGHGNGHGNGNGQGNGHSGDRSNGHGRG